MLLGTTLVYTTTLPSSECQRVDDGGETLYVCNGVVYRATNYQNELVYEIVSPDPAESQPVEGMDEGVLGLQLTEPMTSGPSVRLLQMTLKDAGYAVGAIDGIFGSATETALMWYQYDNDLEPNGIVDEATALVMGFLTESEVELTETPSDDAATSEAVESGTDATDDGVDAGETDEATQE